jgi:hemolysin activation/secretion protein
MPLAPKDTYAHNLTLGIDYKDFEEKSFFGGTEAQVTPVSYLPLSVSYSGSLPDSTGVTQFSGGLTMAFRHLVTKQDDFEIKRFQARGNFLYATLGVERNQTLPFGFNVFAKLDGQLSSEPLISNEQYVTGGMESVRGYKESEESGDDAIHCTVEFLGPDLGKWLQTGDQFSVVPYLFFDAASLNIQDPFPGTASHAELAGTGMGIRGLAFGGFEYEVVWGMPLESTTKTDSGEIRTYFRIKYSF